MSYKTILVQVDDSRHVDSRIDIAAQIAVTDNAHLIGSAMTGATRFLYETVAFNPGDPAIAPYLDILRQRAMDALDKFEKIARQIGVKSFEKRLVDDEAVGGIRLQARYCDLVILGQSDPAESITAIDDDFPESVVLHSGCPVLIIPYARTFKSIGTNALIAWNASVEARRAVHNAIPLLKRARTVNVAVFTQAGQLEDVARKPADDLALYLARHGIQVQAKEERIDHDVGNALLSLAENLGSDLLVMGCYGHSRYREILLGGVTRTILQSMTVPVLMSH